MKACKALCVIIVLIMVVACKPATPEVVRPEVNVNDIYPALVKRTAGNYQFWASDDVEMITIQESDYVDDNKVALLVRIQTKRTQMDMREGGAGLVKLYYEWIDGRWILRSVENIDFKSH